MNRGNRFRRNKTRMKVPPELLSVLRPLRISTQTLYNPVLSRCHCCRCHRNCRCSLICVIVSVCRLSATIRRWFRSRNRVVERPSVRDVGFLSDLPQPELTLPFHPGQEEIAPEQLCKRRRTPQTPSEPFKGEGSPEQRKSPRHRTTPERP